MLEEPHSPSILKIRSVQNRPKRRAFPEGTTDWIKAKQRDYDRRVATRLDIILATCSPSIANQIGNIDNVSELWNRRRRAFAPGAPAVRMWCSEIGSGGVPRRRAGRLESSFIGIVSSDNGLLYPWWKKRSQLHVLNLQGTQGNS